MILPVVVLLFKHQCHKPLRRRIPHIRRELDRHRLAARDVRAFHLLDDKLDGFVRDGVDVLLDIRHEGELRIVERDELHVLRHPPAHFAQGGVREAGEHAFNVPWKFSNVTLLFVMFGKYLSTSTCGFMSRLSFRISSL